MGIAVGGGEIKKYLLGVESWVIRTLEGFLNCSMLFCPLLTGYFLKTIRIIRQSTYSSIMYSSYITCPRQIRRSARLRAVSSFSLQNHSTSNPFTRASINEDVSPNPLLWRLYLQSRCWPLAVIRNGRIVREKYGLQAVYRWARLHWRLLLTSTQIWII